MQKWALPSFLPWISPSPSASRHRRCSTPILFPKYSVNHKLPSGPVVMSSGKLPLVGTGNSVITPAGVILPILSPPPSANHKLPSGPLVMSCGRLPLVGMGNSVFTPAVVILPIWFPEVSVNHGFQSGPAVILWG